MEPITLAELFERYGDLRNLDKKTMVLYSMLLTRLRAFLGHEPSTADLDDLTISRYLRHRATNVYRGQPIRPASVQKDKVMIAAVWNLAARKRWVSEFPELPRIKVAKSIPTGRAYTAEDVAALIRRARRHDRGTALGVVVEHAHLHGVLHGRAGDRPNVAPLGRTRHCPPPGHFPRCDPQGIDPRHRAGLHR